jgi:3-hydroxyacyl-CoA dehydrogenase/enoyl-CoA hydratase/3-hydroxybutyryl-CoA epimerase
MIYYQKDIHNIVTLTLDMKGRNMNVINHEIREAFVPVLRHLQEEKEKSALKGVILTSAKKTFLAGGDLEYLYQATDSTEIFAFAEEMKAFLRELERPGVPVVAAINGSAIGAGFELALACHHRIAVDQSVIKLGLPEVEIGLIPGGGGIIRLMWLLGIERAFAILKSGRRYSPKEALQNGIIDELATSEKEMMQLARQWLLSNQEGRRPWDQKNAEIPEGTARDQATAQVIRRLTANLARDTHPALPAPRSILKVLAEGSKVDFDTACRIESRYYTQLVRSQQCKNMIKAFWFDANYIKEGKNRPSGYGKFRPRKIGVIGAGLMGSGIALACLLNGMDVVLKDVSKLIAERGREFVEARLKERVARGVINEDQRAEILSRIKTTEDSSDFTSCDLVIEAVFENRMVKQKVTREAEDYLDDFSFFATNTISIPITRLAEATRRPEHYVGLHFFHPADEIPLVEIVKGAQTSPETIARAFDFVRAIRKTPIIVKDDWGFFAARVRNTYILEGITMLQEGYSPALIENLGIQAGMPIGALSLADELGLNMVMRYEKQAAEHYGPKYIQHPAVNVLNVMLEEVDRPGIKKRAGFYDYPVEDAPILWTDIAEHFPVKTRRNIPTEELMNRFLTAQVLEAIWCMQERVIHSIPAANLGSIYGWGFPAFRGGVIQYILDRGVDAFTRNCQRLRKKHGQRFQVPSKMKQILAEDHMATEKA